MVMDLKTIEDDVRRMALETERILNLCFGESEVLLSRQGTVRGRKFHVHNTIRRLKYRNTWKRDYVADEEGKIVIYMTSCGVVHSTWKRCHEAVVLLQNLNIQAELRDLNLNGNLVDELIDRLQLKQKDRNFVFNNLPLIYVNGFYFGNEMTLAQSNEQGHLATTLRNFYVMNLLAVTYLSKGRKNCDRCGGGGYTLCSECRGSKRSKRSFQDLILRCAQCDQNGIVLCKECLSQSH